MYFRHDFLKFKIWKSVDRWQKLDLDQKFAKDKFPNIADQDIYDIVDFHIEKLEFIFYNCYSTWYSFLTKIAYHYVNYDSFSINEWYWKEKKRKIERERELSGFLKMAVVAFLDLGSKKDIK